MTLRLLSRSALLVVMVLATLSPAMAQESPFNMSEVSNFDQSGQRYGDVWGDGDYAYLAHFGQSRVDIVDISDPANPQLAATYNTGGGSAQDVKVGDGLMFVGVESASLGVHIVDVRDPTQPTKLTSVTVINAVHNTFYYEGWLYIVGSGGAKIEIVDLRSYDPDNPPATISSSTWTVNGVGSFAHDITAQGNFLFASAWSSVRVYDITNIATEAPTFLASANGSAVHAAWATDDFEYLVTAEERTGGGLTLYEMVGGAGTGQALSLVKRDTFTISTSRAGSVHNPVIRGNTVYTSWYQVGVQVLDIDRAQKRFVLAASFDTTASTGPGFGGCWGVYPFLGDDRVLASDMNTGLWVLEAQLSGGPQISLSGSCPGTVTVDVTGATPNSEVALVSAGSTNGFVKGGNLCNGVTMEIGEPLVLPPTFVLTDATGAGSTTMTLQSGSCWVEALDLGSCRTSGAQSADD